MKTKRNKANRRTMQIYNSVFKFREPYQVLFDADSMITFTTQKFDLNGRFQSVLGGTIKPMITQCTIAHLVKLATEGNQVAQESVDLARSTCERRKCNHWKTKSSSIECIKGIIGDEDNKLRYMICTQDSQFRTYLRESIIGLPILYVNRSGLLLLEDEGPATERRRKELEENKLHVPVEELELLKASTSQLDSKLEIEEQVIARPGDQRTEGVGLKTDLKSTSAQKLENKLSKKFKQKRIKGPNPLSVKKKKKNKSSLSHSNRGRNSSSNSYSKNLPTSSTSSSNRKRKRKQTQVQTITT